MRWKDRQTGDRKEATEWHRIVLYNRLAEIAGEYLKKGRQVYIEGRLQTRKWQDKDGQDRYTTEIVANELHMLGNRTGGTSEFSGTEQPQGNYAAAPTRSAPAPQHSQASAYPTGNMPPPPPNYDDFDDDIPF